MTYNKEFDKKQIERIRNTLTIERQKEFDLGMQMINKRKELYRELAKT